MAQCEIFNSSDRRHVADFSDGLILWYLDDDELSVALGLESV